MTNIPLTIAIDGPAASGKSTVGQLVADRLGYLYFDTGAMYRALTLLALEHHIELSDGAALGKLAEETNIEIEPPASDCKDHRQYTVRVGNADITWSIRHHLVDRHVSEVAAHSQVRSALKRQQRRIGLGGQVVMVGRDIGTVVMPDAPVKIYLDASPEERAQRRQADCAKRGEAADYDELLAAIRERDRHDSAREFAPLRAAEDAHLVLTDRLPVEEVVRQILIVAQQAGIAPATQEELPAQSGG